jgi:integration host factor subunit beta
LAIVKSKLLNQLKKSYPNFLKKDLEKVVSVVLNEVKQALKRGDRVELRNFGIFSTNIQKARISRNPKTGEKVNTPKNNSL